MERRWWTFQTQHCLIKKKKFSFRGGSQSECGAENLLCTTVGVGLKSPCCIFSTTSGLSPIGVSTGIVILSVEGTSAVAGVMEKVGWLGGVGSGSPMTRLWTVCDGVS